MFRSPDGLARPVNLRRWWLTVLVTGLLVGVLPLNAQAASEPQVIINASGGDAGEPGLRIHYGSGVLQVFRDGVPQFYNGSEPNPPISQILYNAIALNLEGEAYFPVTFFAGGTAFPDSAQSGGSASGSGTISGTLDTGVEGFVAIVTIGYIYPNNYFTVTITIDREATSAPLKLYHFGVGSQFGSPGFHVVTPPTVGITPFGRVSAFRYVSGPNWSGYYGGYFATAWYNVRDGDNFDNTIETDFFNPKSHGVMWDLGTASGIQTVSYDMIFTDVLLPAPDQMAAPIGVAGDTSVTVTITAPNDNGFAITGYTVTASPGRATCAIAPSETSCIVPGLTNGIAYTFTATASGANGTSAASPSSSPVIPTVPTVDSDDPLVIGITFTDIAPGEMAVAASWLALRGIALGCEDGPTPRFCPNDLATRAEVATFLSRALGLPATTIDAFRDDDAHPLEDGLNRTAASGVFLGCSLDRDVCPDDEITRGELSAVLVRAFDLVTATPAEFSDVGQHWARPFIETIGGLGISIGCTADGESFCPEDFGTRGEIALFLHRALTLR